MDCVSTEFMEIIPDYRTDSRLLPELFRNNDNSNYVAFYKSALRKAMNVFLTGEQREILRMHYHDGMSKTRIGEKLGITQSAASKRIRSAENILRSQMSFASDVYEEMIRKNLFLTE